MCVIIFGADNRRCESYSRSYLYSGPASTEHSHHRRDVMYVYDEFCMRNDTRLLLILTYIMYILRSAVVVLGILTVVLNAAINHPKKYHWDLKLGIYF